ncbi:unnamed protein product [Brassicogethes aeneus]|uniref:Translation initiation factor eIF2B subunit delta n=1 Tax=Brassicogethes aeneus TaxID=1431903 RepID=A0A9P0B9Y3_BRAAE|nr:unnamed protein product [Brassicogethes aeneus]
MSDKKGAVGPDGLTKKERRALKVQAKQGEGNPAPVENKTQDNKKAVASEKDVKKIADTPVLAELSEKEKRKLEWQKKLAEQNVSNKEKEALSKAELKHKRREQQEAQRLAKAKEDESKKVPVKVEVTVEKEKSPLKKVGSPVKKPDIKKNVKSMQKVQLVQHLYCEDQLKSEFGELIVNYKNVHPAFIRLGVQYSTKTILGSNARCLALLSALKHLVEDLHTPPKQEYCRYLESVLQTCTAYLQNCRPLAVSMVNALRHFKLQLTHINNKLSDNEKKAMLIEVIEIYINDDIKKAGDAISLRVNEKINKSGDVILTYGCSSLIRKILLEAHSEGKDFEVIVADGRPLLEGRELLRRLVQAGIRCSYVLINSLSCVMGNVTKVLLGAHALLTNGYVMSRIGTAQVALVANAFNKPVLVCCETYKFSEKVQTDSFVHNEIGDENALSKIDTAQDQSPLIAFKENSKLMPLTLLYDVTPPDMVTAVVTELAILPCTSVPVVLRINANEVN